MSVSESWLNDKINDNVIAIDGYEVIRHDRVGRLGGEVLMYIKTGNKFNVLKKSTHEIGVITTEFIAVEVTFHHNKLLIISLYNPPGLDCSDLLNELLSDFSPNHENVFLLGDFNTNILETTACKAIRFLNTLTTYSMSNLGCEPTFFHRNGASQLDLIITNNPSKVLRITRANANGAQRTNAVHEWTSFRSAGPKRVPFLVHLGPEPDQCGTKTDQV